jgi:ketosteroid isomerase-like protein
MDRRQLLLGSLVGVAGFAGRSESAQKTQGGPQPQRVADAERSFAATMAKRDANGFAAHISEEAIFMGSSDTPRVLRGRAAIVEGWKQFFDGPTAPFSWEPDIAEVLDSGTMALTSGPVSDPAGQLIGRFNSIWRLEPDGRWRVLFDRGAPVCG